MADTAVAITAGTGTNIDTRTEGTNGNHRQVVVLGDPATNAGVAPVDATNGLSVNVTNSSLTVGTHAVTQSGTWTVQPGNTANTTPWLAKLSDGTNAVAVKAASTAPSATDPAIVVALSPNGLNANGAATSANSAPMVPATDWVGTTAMSKFSTGYYVTIAASQTASVLQSSTGATGDYVSGILVIPATTSPGNVLLLDNATSITVFAGGATSVSNLVPFFIPLGAVSRSGAWKLTTGANVSCIAIGKFS